MTRPLCTICHKKQSYKNTQVCKSCAPDAPIADRLARYECDSDYLIVGPNWGRNTRLAAGDVKKLVPHGFEPGDKLRQVKGGPWYHVERNALVVMK